jgi:hypothetical protein
MKADVYLGYAEAIQIQRTDTERLYCVSRSGVTFYTIAKSPREARAKVSRWAGDEVSMCDRTPLEKLTDKVKKLSPAACREVVRLLEE